MYIIYHYIHTLGCHTYRHDENFICIDILFAMGQGIIEPRKPYNLFHGFRNNPNEKIVVSSANILQL